MTQLIQPFRQIHLDFHNSEHLPDIASAFDPHKFARILSRAHVNSVNLFARCHHGWLYYDSLRFPERRHPHLKRPLLKEQIEACHSEGIRTPLYVTVQWDDYTARRHPEWLARTPDGAPTNIYGRRASGVYEPGFYRALCVNSPYLDFLKAHVAELLELFPVDGFWFDIVTYLDDSSHWTVNAMLEQGLEPSDPEQRRAFGVEVIHAFQRDMTAFVRQFNPDCSIFYNAGHISTHLRHAVSSFTHIEIESIASGEWGYEHFPFAARYTRTICNQWLGMTGKFHTQWGDFHSFKNQAALEFECFQMLAHGGSCSIGDQLHPDGNICEATYELIGKVYAQVREREPWCVDSKPVVEIGVFNPGEFIDERTPRAGVGAMRMLQELGYQFDVIDTVSDWTKYRLLILPDDFPITDTVLVRLNEYYNNGGALLGSYHGGMNVQKTQFTVDWGAQYLSEAPYTPDFIMPNDILGHQLPRTEHVMYTRGTLVQPDNGSQVLAWACAPYFNRTYRHYTSHAHTPSTHQLTYPAVVQKERKIYFIHPIFTQYRINSPAWYKHLLNDALERLLAKRLIVHDGPSSLIVTLNEQLQQKRYIVHLLHYIPARNSETMDIIEHSFPLYNTTIKLNLPRLVDEAWLEPQHQALELEYDENALRLTVPQIHGHQIISLKWRS